MKILHVISSMGPGGAEKLLDEMLPILSEEKNIDVELLILSQTNNEFLKKVKKSNVKVVYSPIKNPRSLRNLFFLYRYIKKNKFDMVHSHLFPDKYFISIIAYLLRRQNIKFITTEHNTHNRRRDIHWMKYLERIVYSNYDKVISITESTEVNLINWLDLAEYEKDKYVVINNGVNIEEFMDAQPYCKKELDPSLTEDSKLLCMVGSFTKQKDQKTIIKALSYLPDNIKLILVGDGPQKSCLVNIAEQLGVENRVIFLGIRTDVASIYKTIDIAIVSSNWEGFGLVAVEGMAAGKPVIASDLPGLSEVVGGYGCLFQPGQAKKLAKKVSSLLSNKYNHKLVAERCQLRAGKYNIEDMAFKYSEEYHDYID